MAVDECKAKTTSTQFVDWQVKFAEDEKKKWTETAKWEHYMADLKAYFSELNFYMRGIYRAFGGTPQPDAFKSDSFVLHYTFQTDQMADTKKKKPEAELTEEEIQQRVLASKSAWFGFVGLTQKVT